MQTGTLICCPPSVFTTVAPSCSASRLTTAVKQFSSPDLSQNDVKVIHLSKPMKKTHMKDAAVIVGHQAAWPGWGDHCFWAFVSCGELSRGAPPLMKENALHHPLFFVTVFYFHPSLMGVTWMLSASCLLVCDACCGLSVGTFKAAAPAAVEPQSKTSDIKRFGRLVGHQRRLLLIGGKFVAHGVCMSEAGEAVQHLPVVGPLMRQSRLKPNYPSTLFSKTKR